MILSNEFLTVKATQYDATLNEVNVSVIVTRNSPYYYNRQGILFVLYRTPTDSDPTRIVWYTDYNKDAPPADGSVITALDGHDYTVHIGDSVLITLENIVLNTDYDEDRSVRQYVNHSLINLFANDGVNPTAIFRDSLTIATVEMPSPIIKELSATLLNINQVEIKWMGTNPEDFYEYELWDSESPTYPIFKSSVNAHLKKITHTLSTSAQGKTVIFKLLVKKRETLFEQKSIAVKLPKEEFDFFYKDPIDDTKRVVAMYKKDTREDLSVFWNRALFIHYKQAGFWYTD